MTYTISDLEARLARAEEARDQAIYLLDAEKAQLHHRSAERTKKKIERLRKAMDNGRT